MSSPHDLLAVSPEIVSIDPGWLQQTEARIAAHLPGVTSLLVARHNHIAFERYFGIQADEPQDTQSVTKSLVALLTGVAVQRGLLRVDQPILEVWPHGAGTITDSRWLNVTVRHLLTMTSGLPSEVTDPVYDAAWFLNTDPLRFTLAQTLVADPGQVFHYSNAGVHLLGAVLSQATGQPLEDFAQDAVLSPLGIAPRPWTRDAQGRVWGGGMLHLTPREMLRLGRLVLHGGQWHGKAVVPAHWVRQMTRPSVQGYAFMEGLPRYGWLWWLPGPAEIPCVYATGYGGQYIAVSPALDLVVVMTGRVSDHPSHRHVIPELMRQILASEATSSTESPHG